jgi:acyl-CoA synthetase (AMP-forming)/AMP-acid ligase II
MSAPSRIRQSNSAFSLHMDIRRSRSNASLGRSRYRDSYMATSFKAIEPAPQPKLLLNDPADQMFLADLAGRQMTPLKGRPIPFTLYDADNKTILTNFSNLAELLRFRSTKSNDNQKDAFVLVDARGKEPESLTWDKLNARAEKIANTLRQKGNIKPGDRVALIYRKSEVLEFIPALFGCFLAGVTAVPINAAEDLAELSFILTLTNVSLILTTEYNQRAFTKDLQTKQVEFPVSISWWNTNTMGTWYPSKKATEYPIIKVPDVAYIEYAKASNGELKGVTVTHASIMEQCAAFQAATTETSVTTTSDGGVKVQPKQNGRIPDVVVSYFEPRQQIGLILSVLISVYAGNSTIFTSGSIVDTPAVWIYVLSKYKGNISSLFPPPLNYLHFSYTN